MMASGQEISVTSIYHPVYNLVRNLNTWTFNYQQRSIEGVKVHLVSPSLTRIG